MSYDNQQHPAPISFHEGGYRKNANNYPNSGVHLPDQGDSRLPPVYPQQGNRPSQAGAPHHDPLDGAGNVVQRQTSPGNLQQGKPSTDVPSLDKVVKDLKDSSGPVGGSVPGFPPSSAAPSPSAGTVIQRQTSPRNLQQGKSSTDVPSLDKAGNIVQAGQTSPRSLKQGKPSTDVPSLDKVVKDIKDSSGPVGGSVPGFPPPSPAPSPLAGNVIQHQTSPRNLQQGNRSTDVPSLDKAGNAVQHQTSPGNLPQGKPSTNVASLDKVVRGLEGSSGPVGGPVPDFPPIEKPNCIRKCLAALSPCCVSS